jgi:hypothetical protein
MNLNGVKTQNNNTVMQNKPYKCRYKLYVLCSTSGFAYNFEIYTGQENEPASPLPDLGASSNVVVRLTRVVPRNVNYNIHFYN